VSLFKSPNLLLASRDLVAGHITACGHWLAFKVILAIKMKNSGAYCKLPRQFWFDDSVYI